MITITYNSTKSFKHAYDYLTTYNYSEKVNNDPCAGVAGCSLSSFTTTPIPPDPNVSGGIQPTNQVFTLFGGTLLPSTSSQYTTVCGTNGDCDTSLIITFIANTTNPVLAYGGHIALKAQYTSGSASDIPGSPYHMSLTNFSSGTNTFGLGSQDRSLKVTQVIVGPTASTASVSGKVVNSFGRSNRIAVVSILNTTSGQTQYAIANKAGRYQFNDLPVGDFYVVSVRVKGTTFGSEAFTLTEDLTLNLFAH